jgi:GTP-binding protein EngB required for normal cell division
MEAFSMNESKIKDFKWELETYLKKVISECEKHQFPSVFAVDIKEKMQKYQPSLMFYGIYNAGKSTLLNATFGELKASVADVPETHIVTPYKWNGYDLVDTPGINGPEKDYKISKEELVKHDVIMFVIDDSDSFDNRLVAEEIVQIIENEKPLIIVLNNKQAVDENTQNIHMIRNKLYENIKIAAEERHIFEVDKKYSFITVNARSAFNGRTGNKKLLVQKSNIEKLEILILQKLKEQAGLKLLLPPTDILLNQLRALIKSLQSQLSTEKEKQLLELIGELIEKKTTLLKTIQTNIRFEFHKAFNTFYEQLSKNQSIDSEVEQLHQRINKLINTELDAALKMIEGNLDDFYHQIELNRGSLQVAGVHMGTDNTPTKARNQIMSSGVPTSQVLTSAVEKTITGVAGNELLLKTMEKGVTQLATSTAGKAVMQKLGIKSIAPFIAPVAPILNVLLVVSVVKDVISLFSNQSNNEEQRRQMEFQAQEANRQQQEALTQRMNALQELRTQLNLELYKMEEETMNSVNKGVAALFDNLIAEIRKDLNMVSETNSNIEQSLTSLNTTLTDLEGFKMNLV